jgi:hypothetical protein
LGAISRRSAGTLRPVGRYKRDGTRKRIERFHDSGVARLPLLGNFSYLAIFLHNFSLTNYYPRWETKE